MRRPGSKQLEELEQEMSAASQAPPSDEASFAVFDPDDDLDSEPEQEFDPDTYDATTPTPGNGHGLPAGVSALPNLLGLILVIIALVLAAAPAAHLLAPATIDRLARLGITPAVLFFSGILLAVLSLAQAANIRRSSRVLLDVLDENTGELQDAVQRIRAVLPSEGWPPHAEPGNFGETHRALSRMEGMLASLTKAVRMHNRPLGNLVEMVKDQGKRLDDQHQSTPALKLDLEAIKKAVGELLTSGEKKWEGMFRRLHQSESELENNMARTGEMLFERLQPQIAEEMRRLGGQLENQWDTLREQVEKGLKELEAQTRDEIQAIGRRMDDLQPPHGGGGTGQGLEQALADIRQALAGLQDRQTAAAAPAPPPRATEPAAARSRSRTSTANKKTATDEAGAAGQTKVLSAIERLKQLRGG